jgi:RHH-type rel operon transcriptional repressor/antitoxin RelB
MCSDRRCIVQVRHNITLDLEVSHELESVSKELGEKKSYIIEKALTAYFDLMDLSLAEKRMQDLEKGEDTIIDAEDVWKNIGI